MRHPTRAALTGLALATTLALTATTSTATPTPKPAPASQSVSKPAFWTAFGATVENISASGGIGIGHWWTDRSLYEKVIYPGQWSDIYWQNNQSVYVGSGYGYVLYTLRGDGYRTWYIPISAGRGPIKIHLTTWTRYQIKSFR